jgi:hypothetical protein
MRRDEGMVMAGGYAPYHGKIPDGRTWQVKRQMVHDIQDKLGISDAAVAGLFGLSRINLALFHAEVCQSRGDKNG